MIPVMLCITGPIGSYCGDLLCKALTAINNVAPWSSVLIVGCLAPLLVLTGMHLALIPLVMSMFATAGYDNMLFVAFIGMNFSQFGVALACMLKLKIKTFVHWHLPVQLQHSWQELQSLPFMESVYE